MGGEDVSQRTTAILKGVAGLVIMGIGWSMLPRPESIAVGLVGQSLVIIGVGLWYRRNK